MKDFRGRHHFVDELQFKIQWDSLYLDYPLSRTSLYLERKARSLGHLPKLILSLYLEQDGGNVLNTRKEQRTKQHETLQHILISISS